MYKFKTIYQKLNLLFFRVKNKLLYETCKIISTIKIELMYIKNLREIDNNIDINKVDNVIFIAHPDDEIVFFSKILREYNNLVVCMTNGGDSIRFKEFINVSKILNNQIIIYNFRDGVDVVWNEKKVINKIKSILNLKEDWNFVITHNSEGEYGHIQHIQLNDLVKKVYRKNNLYTTIKKQDLQNKMYKLDINDKLFKENIIKEYYKSQKGVLKFCEEYFEYEGIVNK